MSTTLAWATDLHLDSVDAPDLERFCGDIVRANPDVILLGGDIADASDLHDWLRLLAERFERPIYFVLGNHDYYGGDIASVRTRVRELEPQWLRWLPDSGCVELNRDTALVGHGGWGDARLGDFSLSPVLTDYLAIKDLADQIDLDDVLSGFRHRASLKRKLGELGDEAAESLRGSLQQAVLGYAQVVVLTHVPPFRDACWHAGRISTEDWLPGFSCKATGDILIAEAARHPECRITVLCGHTHGGGEAQVLPNLHVHTGDADYGSVGFRWIEVGEPGVTVAVDPWHVGSDPR